MTTERLPHKTACTQTHVTQTLAAQTAATHKRVVTQGTAQNTVLLPVKKAHRLVAPWVWWACTAFGALAALEANANTYTYDEKFTALAIKARPNGGSVFTVDPYQWVVTSAFAKKFGMPQRFVDDSLIGAEAIAYKIVTGTNQTCGYGRNAEACAPSQYCLFDFYVKKEANLPWQDDRPQGFRQIASHLSTRFVNSADKKQHSYYNENFPSNQNSYVGSRIGLGNAFFVRNTNKKVGDTNDIFTHGWLETFDREFVHGIDLFSINNCSVVNNPNKKGWLELSIREASVRNNLPTQHYGKRGWDIPVVHSIRLPKTYTAKLHAYHKKTYGNDFINLAKKILANEK